MSIKSKRITFRGDLIELEFHRYLNDRIMIGAVEVNTGELYMDITVNMPQIFLRDNEIIIKDYSENEGIFKILNEAGIVGSKLFPARSGYVEATVCELLINPEDYEISECDVTESDLY